MTCKSLLFRKSNKTEYDFESVYQNSRHRNRKDFTNELKPNDCNASSQVNTDKQYKISILDKSDSNKPFVNSFNKSQKGVLMTVSTESPQGKPLFQIDNKKIGSHSSHNQNNGSIKIGLLTNTPSSTNTSISKSIRGAKTLVEIYNSHDMQNKLTIRLDYVKSITGEGKLLKILSYLDTLLPVGLEESAIEEEILKKGLLEICDEESYSKIYNLLKKIIGMCGHSIRRSI